MDKELQKIVEFLKEHHVMSLATYSENVDICSLFYVYSVDFNTFVVASSEDTNHISNILKNNKVAGNILLETKEIGVIRGVQFKATMEKLEDDLELKKLYFKTFPYAIALVPTLWKIEVNNFKMTDNRLGFGKKIVKDFNNDFSI